MLKLFFLLALVYGGHAFPCSNDNVPSSCEPRPQMVRIAPVGYPQFALLQRCGGNCEGGQGCTAIETRSSNISVTVDDKCEIVPVVEETQCGCNCDASLTCDDIHTLNRKTCQCDCDFQSEECGPGFHVDPQTCACRCDVIEKCDTNQIFEDTVLCKCVGIFFDHE